MVIDLPAMLRQEVDNWALLGYPALLQRFVLRNGTLWQGRKRPRGFRRREIKQCFSNSTQAVCDNPRLTYCEGIAVSRKLAFPVHHAWCLMDGQVVDLTWEAPEDCAYLGIQIQDSMLFEELAVSGVYGVLDTGVGLNARFMFKIDPPLAKIVEQV